MLGTTFVVMSKFGLAQFAGAFRVAGKAFVSRIDDAGQMIARIVELATIARRGGLLHMRQQQRTDALATQFVADVEFVQFEPIERG